MRCMRHRMLLIALITMVCSDPTDSNALSRDSHSKSEAPRRRDTWCAGRRAVREYGKAVL